MFYTDFVESSSVDLVMETLVVVAQHKNQYYGPVRSNRSGRFGSSSPSRNFRDINCRAFESGAGILPTPIKTFSVPATKGSSSVLFPSSPKTPSPSVNRNTQSFDGLAQSKSRVKSNPIAINFKTRNCERYFNEKCSSEFDTFSYSELWAGPAYSNSPPPSSLPIPKFSMRPKRTVSLDLPANDGSDIEIPHLIAKSAPASPTRAHNGFARDMFLCDDSATKTLRRILNLDNADE